MRKKAQEGWLPSNHVPLGYVHQRNKDENGREKKRGTTIVPDSNPQTIRLILREFELRAQAYSYDAIHETTVEEGLISNRKTYSRSGIEKRLKNPFYSGEFDWDGVRYKGKLNLLSHSARTQNLNIIPTPHQKSYPCSKNYYHTHNYKVGLSVS